MDKAILSPGKQNILQVREHNKSRLLWLYSEYYLYEDTNVNTFIDLTKNGT